MGSWYLVPEKENWNNLFNKFKKTELQGRKRFNLNDLEIYIKEKLGGAAFYQAAGGYQNLFQLLKKLEAEQKIRAIKSSDFNQRQPQLKERWTLIKEEFSGWSDKDILKLSRLFDLSYYLKRSKKQTPKLKVMLFKIAKFLKNKQEREWASREERSLELFGDEKFLNQSQGKKLLSNLKLNLADLKAEHYKHLFVYWTLNPTEINNILIMENHSAFISAKRALAAGIDIFGKNFDTLIYGQGKNIIRSFSFLEELLELNQAEAKIMNFKKDSQTKKENFGRKRILKKLNIYYAGDLDPEGLAIYISLKNKYPEFKIKLLIKYYQLLFKLNKGPYFCQNKQQKNKKVLKEVMIELKQAGFEDLSLDFENLWSKNSRLPQELITLEVLKNFQKD